MSAKKLMSLQDVYASLQFSCDLSSGYYFLSFPEEAAKTVNALNGDLVDPNVLYNIESDFSYGFDISDADHTIEIHCEEWDDSGICVNVYNVCALVGAESKTKEVKGMPSLSLDSLTTDDLITIVKDYETFHADAATLLKARLNIVAKYI